MRPPAASFIRSWSNINLVFDGNSLVQGTGASAVATTSLPALVASLAPVSGAITCKNIGVAGQTYRQMDGLDGGVSTDVDGAWVSSKTNVLLLWEGTNSICNSSNQSASQAIASLQSYVANRRAAHPGWIIVALTCLPRGQVANGLTVAASNAILQAHDALLRASYRDLGINRLVDVQLPGSPFALPDFTTPSFAALGVDGTTGLWSSASGTYIHLSDLGYSTIANMVMQQAMRRMPLR